MRGLALENNTGVWTIQGTTDSVSMHKRAWRIRDLSPLLFNLKMLQGNVPLDGASGTFPMEYTYNEIGMTLVLDLAGDIDKDDNPTSGSVMQGAFDNYMYLRSQILTPPDGGTYSTTLVGPDESTEYDADVQIVAITFSERTKDLYTFDLDIIVPAGRFV